jgi:hypothetical protein
MHLQLILVLVSLGALVGCAYPKTVRAYDEECQIVAREMVLDVTDPNASRTCGSNGCVGQLVLEAAVLAASTVVSGSIVVAGTLSTGSKRSAIASRSRLSRSPPLLLCSPRTERSSSA